MIEKDVSFEQPEESSFQEKEPKETPTSSKKVSLFNVADSLAKSPCCNKPYLSQGKKKPSVDGI